MTKRGKQKQKRDESKRLSKINLNLKAKLILSFVTIALVPLMILTAVIIFQTQGSLTAIIDDNLTTQAERISLTMGDSINQLRSELLGLAVNPSIEQMVLLKPTNMIKDRGLENKTIAEMEAIMDETRNLETNARTQAFLHTTVTDFDGFAELIAVNLDGMVLGATARPDRFIHKEEAWFYEALEKGTYISDVHILPGQSIPGIIIATVVNRTTTGKPVGLIRGLIPLTHLTDALSDTIGKIAAGELQLIIKNEVVMSAKNAASGTVIDLYLDKSSPRAILLPNEAKEGLGETSSGQDAIATSQTVRLGANSAIDLDWQIRLAQPTTTALALINQLSQIGIVGVILTALLVATMAFLVAGSIAGPLNELTEHAKGVATGYLRQYRPKRLRHDETGALTSAFNGMTSHLARLLHRIRTASNDLATSSQEISAGMEEMAAGAQHQIEDIQSGTDQIDEMNRAMTAIDNRANKALELSKNAAEAATKGQGQAQVAVSGMDTIKTSVDGLGEQTKVIARILGFIQDLAEQTNLLALNAAIEAARAGEQGRSFAVVAQEVRVLAERSQTATAEIGQVLRDIQTETVRSIASVEDGRQQVLEVQQVLQEITRATKATEVLIQAIAKESVEQTGRTKEAVSLFGSIGQITEQTAAGTEETAAAAQNLAELAQQLQNIIASFQS